MKTALVIVPHQDDETNLVGNTIGRIKERYYIYILYSSLDVLPDKGKNRKKEAIEACKVWGISESNLIFLDHPDTSNKKGKHYYTEGDKRIVEELKDWIFKLTPDLIVATDFDYHSDHRMLSIAFETAMGQVLILADNYHPIVLKGFCYETSYYSVDDYKASSPGNSVSTFDPLSNPSFEWDKRLRIESDERPGVIWKRKAYKALKAHKSQYAILHARSVINQDNVFWKRSTNNLLFRSKLSSTADEIERIRDFKILDTNDLITKDPRKIDYSIGNCELKRGDWIKAEWVEPVKITRIILHSSINQIEKRNMCISIVADGSVVGEVTELLPYGRATIVNIQINSINVLEFLVNSNVELSEIELIDEEDTMSFYNDSANSCEGKITNYEFIDQIDYLGYQLISLYTRLCRKVVNIIKR